mgnify:FL=1
MKLKITEYYYALTGLIGVSRLIRHIASFYPENSVQIVKVTSGNCSQEKSQVAADQYLPESEVLGD